MQEQPKLLYSFRNFLSEQKTSENRDNELQPSSPIQTASNPSYLDQDPLVFIQVPISAIHYESWHTGLSQLIEKETGMRIICIVTTQSKPLRHGSSSRQWPGRGQVRNRNLVIITEELPAPGPLKSSEVKNWSHRECYLIPFLLGSAQHCINSTSWSKAAGIPQQTESCS